MINVCSKMFNYVHVELHAERSKRILTLFRSQGCKTALLAWHTFFAQTIQYFEADKSTHMII